MAAKKAFTKRTSLMLGCDSDKNAISLKAFYSCKDEQGLSNLIRTKLLQSEWQLKQTEMVDSGCVVIRKQYPPPSSPSTYIDTLTRTDSDFVRQ